MPSLHFSTVYNFQRSRWVLGTFFAKPISYLFYLNKSFLEIKIIIFLDGTWKFSILKEMGVVKGVADSSWTESLVKGLKYHKQSFFHYKWSRSYTRNLSYVTNERNIFPFDLQQQYSWLTPFFKQYLCSHDGTFCLSMIYLEKKNIPKMDMLSCFWEYVY